MALNFSLANIIQLRSPSEESDKSFTLRSCILWLPKYWFCPLSSSSAFQALLWQNNSQGLRHGKGAATINVRRQREKVLFRLGIQAGASADDPLGWPVGLERKTRKPTVENALKGVLAAPPSAPVVEPRPQK